MYLFIYVIWLGHLKQIQVLYITKNIQPCLLLKSESRGFTEGDALTLHQSYPLVMWATTKKVYVRDMYWNGIKLKTCKNEGNIDIPFWGNRVLEVAHVKITMERSTIEIVDLPSYNMVDLSIVVCMFTRGVTIMNHDES